MDEFKHRQALEPGRDILLFCCIWHNSLSHHGVRAPGMFATAQAVLSSWAASRELEALRNDGKILRIRLRVVELSAQPYERPSAVAGDAPS
jgi:hypothetical protein